MRPFITTVFVLVCFLSAKSVMFYHDSKFIDFTKIIKDDPRITIAPADKLNYTKDGLGWDGDRQASRDGSFTTAPIAVGDDWHPARSVTLVGAVGTVSEEFKSRGRLFVRYSPDKKNWSTWQVLPVALEPRILSHVSGQKSGGKGVQFSGRLQVPEIEQSRYDELFQRYQKLDVPWASDEEAAVKWILKQDPDFFSKNLPFIGYVQFHFEGTFRGGVRVTSFEYDIPNSSSMSVIATPPKDPNADKNRGGTWRFDATKEK
jgi:hypothetical protein